MKLTDHETQSIQQATGMDPLPGDAPAQAGLEQHFGEHTFYVAQQGLFVFERDGDDDEDGNGADTARAVRLAVWTEQDGQRALAVVEPQPTDICVDLKAA